MYKHLTPQEIEEFEKEFTHLQSAYSGNKFGTEIVLENSKGGILSFIDTLIGKRERDLLERYNQFLLKHHYTDADIYAEEPTAIDRFLSPEVINHNQH